MRDLKTIFNKEEYDVLIIGGGINGAAIANIASRQGLSVALVEKEDFASGTSSRSTKLVHGGLRYLENFEFDLVRESLRERYIQWKSVPHLVKPLRFIIPVYKGDRRPLWMMKLGVFLYDFLSGKYVVEKHQTLTTKDVIAAIPHIKREGLVGGVAYSDCRMDDARLCLENILSARESGAHIANYAEAVSFLKVGTQLTAGANIKDILTGKQITIKAHHVICAVGPWTNEILRLDTPTEQDKIRLTKGVHIIYKDKIADTALLLQAGKDHRVFFVIPFGEHSLIGTTDTDYAGKPDEVESDRDDVEYLLSEAGKFLPNIKLQRENIVATFAGLRPLVFASGNPSKLSRNHVIEENKSGVMYIMGGKYTTYRAIAQQCVEKVLSGKKLNLGEDYPLYGSGSHEMNEAQLAKTFNLSIATCAYLLSKYGTKCKDVLNLVSQDRKLAELLCPCSLAIKAQVVYSLQSEMAVTADDIIWRRLSLGYHFCATKQCRKVIDTLCAR
ncbi:MAG: glycerol-3-phosphate dehydrogenase [Candidatus Omnitrophica bacterium]|nr:glycerol-3-phosphate dehydrogenase [Candidatus Omnitrophota bacterium]